MKVPKGIILLSFIGLYFGILSLPRLNDVNKATLYPTGSSRTSYIPGLRFEENRGQTDSRAKFICRDNRYILYLTSNGSVIQLPGKKDKPYCTPLEMSLSGARKSVICRGLDQLESRSNYFKGNDPERWVRDVLQYERVKYDGIYEGIDLVYYVRNDHVEFDFILEPGSDPAEIRMDFSGASYLEIGEDGNLTVYADGHDLVYKKPVAWQEQDTYRREVEVRFALAEDHSIYFELGEYERDEKLVIDPVLVYASYLGGSDTDLGLGVAVDDEGCAYLTGSTLSLDFPVTGGAVQPEKAPGYNFLTDVFVAKFAPDGSTLIYSTYLGGYGEDRGNAIAVDKDGNAYITGMTYSHDNTGTPENESFPLMNEYQGDPGSIYEEDIFVTKLNSEGNGLLYSTYLAGDGEDEGKDIAIDEQGNVYITGINFSFDYPIRNAAIPDKPSYYYDAVVTKINPSLAGDASLIYSTYLGGASNDDYGYGIAVDREGHAYVIGTTESTDFPTVNAYQGNKNGTSDDAFVTKLSADGASFVWSTYLGGSNGETGAAIAVDTAGHAYATGTTYSYTDFPVTPGVVIETLPYQGSYARAYVTKFNVEGTHPDYSTHTFVGADIAVDDQGSAWVVGSTIDTSLSTVNAIQDTLTGSGDIFIMKLSPDAKNIPFSSYFGGSGSDLPASVALDSTFVIVGGSTGSSDFPVSPGAHQTVPGGGSRDAFVLKIDMPREEFVVEVWQDTLNHDAARIPETAFDIYFVDLNKPENPFVFIESRSTDAEGFLHLPASKYQEGWPFLLRRKVHSKATKKKNHDIVNGTIYDVYVDNLYIDDNGRIYPDYLAVNVEDTTVTYMEHTWIGINLVVGIEWPASTDYLGQVKAMFQKASSYLYDVTNGQACLKDIAIYDNRDHFQDADILIHASNTEWPRAHVRGYSWWGGFVFFPPAFFGEEKENVNNIYTTPILLERSDHYRTVVHELGHYVFGFYDEYINGFGEHIYPDEDGRGENINFGFMDTQYDVNDPMSSEMSWFETEKYQETKQYSIHHATCWDYFRERVSGIYGGVRAEIHTPLMLGFSEGENVEGPSEKEPGVNSALNFIDETGPDGGERVAFLCKDSSDEPLPGVNARIKKTDNTVIRQGKTVLDGENRGRIRLFGAEPGDEVQFTHTGDDNRYQFKEVLVGGARKGSDGFVAPGEVTEVVLQTLQGEYTMLSKVSFVAFGLINYESTVQPAFSENPTLEVTAGNTAYDPVTLSGEQNVYTGYLSGDSISTAELMFRARDAAGSSFFVPQDLDLVTVDTTIMHIVPASNRIEMWLDSVSMDLENLAILGSDFPCPTTGLPDSTRRVSPVFSIQQSPRDGTLEAFLRIFYRGDTLSPTFAEAVTIYRWEDRWLPMSTNTDLNLYYASTKIEGPGIFAAFLDLTRSHVTGLNVQESGNVSGGFSLHQNYPNPFHASTTISFYLQKEGPVKLRVYNILGKEIETIVSGVRPAGHHEIVWNANDIPPGTYILRLIAEDGIETRKMNLMR